MKVIPGKKSFELKEFLSRPLFAHLSTTFRGEPRESPVWFLWEDEALWIIGNRRTDTFPSRIELEPRCAIGIVDFDRVCGLVQHAGFRGRATIEPFDKSRAKRLLKKYLGEREENWDAQRFIEPLDDPDNVLIRFEATTVVVRDQSYHPNEDLKSDPD
jgi:hypothetical protein